MSLVVLKKIKDEKFKEIKQELTKAYSWQNGFDDFNDNFWNQFLDRCQDCVNDGADPAWEVRASDSASGHTIELTFDLNDFEVESLEDDHE